MKKKFVICFIICIIILLSIIVFAIYVRFNKKHKYSEIISTININYIEYKINKDASPVYNIENYRTLTDEEENMFISSIKSKKLRFKYYKKGYKGIYYNTFIIHYNDGSKINLDKAHIQIIDSNGTLKYNKVAIPYKCEIDENLFK